jgi:UDP-MurNAc hydroxylase
LHVGARYAIPFASNHCFLHRETFHFNHTAVCPDDVKSYYQELAARTHANSECVVMAPGSSWSDREGFRIASFDYSAREGYIESLLDRHHDALVAQYDKEDQATADFDSFRTYFLGLIHSVPWIIRRWMKLRIVFRTRDVRGEHRWLIDIGTGKVEEIGATGGAVEIETPALVLNDCARYRMFSAWTPSKRLRIRLPSTGHLRSVTLFLTLLDLYELDVIPLRTNLSLRALSVRLRRWREFFAMGGMFLKHVVLRRPLNIAGLYALPAVSADS